MRNGDVGRCEQCTETPGIRGAHQHGCAGGECQDLAHWSIRDDPSAPEHDDVIGGRGHLAHQMR
jgi:hypothetical protein